MLQKVNELHEANPMLGLRGVRLGIVKPGLYAMQVRAIVEAACRVKREGGDPQVEIMIPLVATAPELQQMREELEPVAAEVQEREGVTIEHLEWGTMVELPRAAVTAGGDRRVGRLLLVRDERPHADGVRLQPRRHRQVRRDVRGAQARAGEPVRHDRRAGRRAADAIASEEGRAANDHLHLGHLRRARRRPRQRDVLPRASAWTT